MLHNFVISIAHATQRRQHITKTFNAHGIGFTFFDAVTPDCGLNEALARHAPALTDTPHLTTGEKSCFMSHLCLWQKCIDSNLPHIAVFEDDILLSPDAAAFLQNDDWLTQRFTPQHEFILRLESSPLPAHYHACPAVLPHRNRRFLTLASRQICTAGYIISQAAARHLLQYCAALPANFALPLDDWLFGNDFLFHDTLLLAQISPALCIQDGFRHTGHSVLGSQLESERQSKKPNRLPVSQILRHKMIHALNKLPREYQKYQQRIINKHLQYVHKAPKHIIPFQ